MMRSSKPSPLTSPAEETLPAVVAFIFALDDEAVRGGQGGEVDVRKAAGLAEDDIGCAGIIVRLGRADDEVVEAVAIDVAGAGDAEPA